MANEDKLLARFQAHMEPDESVLASVLGTYEATLGKSETVRTGVLIATDRRVAFFAKRLAGFDLESFPYSAISSVDQGKNMMGHKVTFYASGNKIDVKWIKDAARLATFMSAARTNIHARTTSAVAATEPSSVADELAKLAGLREAGHLTEDEFAAQKARVLGG
jgi:hypothetical protein